MFNKIYVINSEQIETAIGDIRSYKNGYLVEIDGREIQSWTDYINQIADKFKFPSAEENIDGYLDWIRDLTWLDEDANITIDGIFLIINNYADFLREDAELKGILLSSFVDIVLPSWGYDIENTMVGGKTKAFNIYLVD